MPIQPPPTLTPAPPVPKLGDGPNVFPAQAYDFTVWQAGPHQDELQQVMNNVHNNATETHGAATAAGGYRDQAQSAAAAAAAASAAAEAVAATTFWESGKVYAKGDVVWSLAQPGKRYVRWVAGSGTTDPASDAANWKAIGVVGQVESQSIGASANAASGNHYVMTAAGITLTMPTNPLDGDQIGFTNASAGFVNVDWSGRTVKGIAPSPQSMQIPTRASVQVQFSSAANTWIEV